MFPFIYKIARICAVMGGSVLSLMIAVTCLSIVGRMVNGMLHTEFMEAYFPALSSLLLAFGIGPINGDYELVEAGMAFAIFAFLPLCQLSLAHASVDVFSRIFPASLNRCLSWLSDILFALILGLIAWQLSNGLYDKWRSGETTFLLEFPIWWAYGLALIMAIITAFIACLIAGFHSFEFITGRSNSFLISHRALGDDDISEEAGS